LKNNISETHWDEAVQDVRKFLKPYELKSLELWSKDFFLSKLNNF